MSERNTQQKEIYLFNKHVSRLFEKCAWAAPYDFKNKESAVFLHNINMLNRTQQMFVYEGLPETISKRNLELLLQVNGFAGIAEVNGELYAFHGGLGGEPDPYYMPTIFTVANPALKFSENLKIDEECVIIPNDSMYAGLMPLLTKFNTAITEAELSLNIATINSRIISLISAGDDRTFESANRFLQDVEDGKLGAIGENQFFEGVRSQPYATGNTNNITSIIEALQYSRATLYNEIGLSANFNMKREALNSAESAINNDILLPLIDNMLECRQLALEKVNEMFGTNITVKLASSWEDNEQEIEQALEEDDSVNEDGEDTSAEENIEEEDAEEEKPDEEQEKGEDDEDDEKTE